MHTTPTSAATPRDAVELVDETRTLTVTVADAWGDIELFPDPTAHISASPDLETFRTTFDEPGVEYFLHPEGGDDYADAIGQLGPPEDCPPPEADDFDYRGFHGTIFRYTSCGSSGTGELFDIAATPEGESIMVVVRVQAASADDRPAVQQVVDTFDLVGRETDEATGSSVVTVTPSTPTACDDVGRSTDSVSTVWLELQEPTDRYCLQIP